MSYSSLVHIFLPISSGSVCGIRNFDAQNPRMDSNLMGYWMEVQVSIMSSSVTYENKLIMRDMTLIRILMIPCQICYSSHLRSIRSSTIICISRGRFYINGYLL